MINRLSICFRAALIMMEWGLFHLKCICVIKPKFLIIYDLFEYKVSKYKTKNIDELSYF